MRKTLKRMSALFLVICMMTATLGFTALADEKTVPKETDTKTVTVSNVETGLTVTAYQITKAEYNENGFVKYVKANNDLAIADVNAPTSDEVAVIAESTTGLTSKKLTEGKDDSDQVIYSEALTPGYWVIVVTGAAKKVYNPMLAGVYYSVSGSDNTMTGGTIDANANWTLETENAYAKSSTITTEKEIVNPGSGNAHGDDVAIGDTVKFQIKSQIPSYSKEYSHVTFEIHDKLSEGLDYITDKDITVTVGTGDAAESFEVAKTVAFSEDGRTMTVTIPSEYILTRGEDGTLTNAGKDVVVTYTAKLNEDAGINFDANTNSAYTEYTNDPSETSAADKKTEKTDEDTTYHYTFGIDASLGGSVKNTEITKELYKIKGKDGKVEVNADTKEVTVTGPLEGAEFTLTRVLEKDAEGKVTKTGNTYTVTSGENGAISFTGLDAGEYVLEETKAPAGYSLEGKTHSVVISATYITTGEDKGKLESYTITIDGEATSTYTASYSKAGETKITTVDKTAIGSTGILNTALSELPSTGGIGTYIFTIVGVMIMVVAGVLYFTTRKKRVQ